MIIVLNKQGLRFNWQLHSTTIIYAMFCCFPLDCFPNHAVYLALFTDVSNTSEIVKKLLNSELEFAFINPEMVKHTTIFNFQITDSFQVLVAANIAYSRFATGTLITKNVHSELVFVLAASKNVRCFQLSLTLVSDKRIFQKVWH